MSILTKVFNAISKEIEISNLESRDGLSKEFREKQRNLIERKYAEFGGSQDLLDKALIFERDEEERLEAERRAEAKAKKEEERLRFQLRKDEEIQKLNGELSAIKQEKSQLEQTKSQLEQTLNNIYGYGGGTTI